MGIWLGLGFAAFCVSGFFGMPISRELLLKLSTLDDWTRRTNPRLYAEKVQPITPFDGKVFKHHRVGKLLKADLTEFGAICQGLQRDAKNLDKRAHVAILPVLVYVLSAGAWFLVR